LLWNKHKDDSQMLVLPMIILVHIISVIITMRDCNDMIIMSWLLLLLLLEHYQYSSSNAMIGGSKSCAEIPNR